MEVLCVIYAPLVDFGTIRILPIKYSQMVIRCGKISRISDEWIGVGSRTEYTSSISVTRYCASTGVSTTGLLRTYTKASEPKAVESEEWKSRRAESVRVGSVQIFQVRRRRQRGRFLDLTLTRLGGPAAPQQADPRGQNPFLVRRQFRNVQSPQNLMGGSRHGFFRFGRFLNFGSPTSQQFGDDGEFLFGRQRRRQVEPAQNLPGGSGGSAYSGRAPPNDLEPLPPPVPPAVVRRSIASERRSSAFAAGIRTGARRLMFVPAIRST
ncbi:unnamed protein product [Nesidiocoris tenuis]|uniref:Uncharacterized protein n=1 Tax=Nesidiocoris tenuis TaxID=355587 RepID=A0A6H5HKH1_9HEMI|nr:unnamed protein product [Nesidiocoris tenuis]